MASNKTFRADSLDALRGITIAMMVLCGTIINWVLPAWNSHAQMPHTGFDPSIYGITWVDLVFPFFLFAMGAAIPFSTASRLEKGHSPARLVWDGVWRGLKLAFFAIFIQNMYPWVLAAGSPATPGDYAMTLVAFFMLFPLFMRLPGKHSRLLTWGIPVVGIVLACFMMWKAQTSHPLPEAYLATCPSAWDIFWRNVNNILYKSNIIILVLGNMAAFATVIYVFTAGKPWVRLALLPLLMGIILGKDTAGSWQGTVFNWSPAPWLYQFNFLKYLFVVIPGTIAGEQLRGWIKSRNSDDNATQLTPRAGNKTAIAVAALAVAIIVVNVTLLFGRHLVANLLASMFMAFVTYLVARRCNNAHGVLPQLVTAAGYMLLLGLCFEAFEGGIRKDDSTFSYYFVTGGLAFYFLAALVVVCDILKWRTVMAPFTLAGKNPMVAYVAPTMFLYPVMNLLGVGESTIPMWESTWYLGLLRGVLFTTLAVALAALLAKARIYWRT